MRLPSQNRDTSLRWNDEVSHVSPARTEILAPAFAGVTFVRWGAVLKFLQEKYS